MTAAMGEAIIADREERHGDVMTVKYLKVINRDRCIGCFSCMYACSRMVRDSAGTGKAALRVRSYAGTEGTFSTRICARCQDPDCAKACPTGALAAAPGGGVRLRRDLCTSCRACVKACAISALQWDEEERVPIPCIHCGQCVNYCPNEVLAMGERREEEPER